MRVKSPRSFGLAFLVAAFFEYVQGWLSFIWLLCFPLLLLSLRVRTSGRDSLKLEGISRQTKLCQPN